MVTIENDLSKAIEARALADMRYLQMNMAEMAKLREENSDEWEIVELTRAIIHDENQLIENLKGEIEIARATSKKPKRL